MVTPTVPGVFDGLTVDTLYAPALAAAALIGVALIFATTPRVAKETQIV
jgi:hypothetical protein